jgi:hypothetical protein
MAAAYIAYCMAGDNDEALACADCAFDNIEECVLPYVCAMEFDCEDDEKFMTYS